jgi:hypothetical protein
LHRDFAKAVFRGRRACGLRQLGPQIFFLPLSIGRGIDRPDGEGTAFPITFWSPIMKPHALPSAPDASTLHRVIEPLADFICAADQPRIALASALRLLLEGVEQTNRVGRRHLESVQAGA